MIFLQGATTLVLTFCWSNTFLFHSHPCLAIFPIMSFLTMAFADGAFEAPDLTTPERLYNLRVEPGLRQRRVTWKPFLGMPEVPDTVEPGHDLHFTDLVNVDICVAP